MGQNGKSQRKKETGPQISSAHKQKHLGCRVPAGIRGTTKTDRPNLLGEMQLALYEPIQR